MDIGSNGPSKTSSHPFLRRQGLSLNLDVPEVASPGVLGDKAQALLYSRYGGQKQAKEGKGYAYGALGLLAQHTSYYDGFGILLSMHQSAAVALRQSEMQATRVVFDEQLTRGATGGSGRPNRSVQKVVSWQRLVERVLNKFLPANTPVDVAIVSNVPASCLESLIAAVAVALVKAAYNFQQLPLPENIVEDIRQTIEEAIDSDFSKAFVMVSMDMHPGKLCILDTLTAEIIPFDVPAREQLAWVLIEVDEDTPQDFNFYQQLGEQGREALELLRQDNSFDLDSFRDVQHEDLPRVLNALPPKYRFIVRHLINENKRVQVMIGAIRNEDWQKLGGLLFISHSSVSNEWKGSSQLIDQVVAEAENMSSDGVHGACMTGRGGAIVVVGLPLALSNLVAEVERQLESSHQAAPKYWLL